LIDLDSSLVRSVVGCSSITNSPGLTSKQLSRGLAEEAGKDKRISSRKNRNSSSSSSSRSESKEHKEKEEVDVLYVPRPSAMCMNEYGDVFVACEFETHSELYQLSRFTPPYGSPPHSTNFGSHHSWLAIQAPPESMLSSPRKKMNEWNFTPRQRSEGAMYGNEEQISSHRAPEVRARAMSVDSGLTAATNKNWKSADSSNTSTEHSDPWGLVSKIARMLSLDEEKAMDKVDSVLEVVGLGPRRQSTSDLPEPSSRTSQSTQNKEKSSTDTAPVTNQGKSAIDEEIDEDEVIAF